MRLPEEGEGESSVELDTEASWGWSCPEGAYASWGWPEVHQNDPTVCSGCPDWDDFCDENHDGMVDAHKRGVGMTWVYRTGTMPGMVGRTPVQCGCPTTFPSCGDGVCQASNYENSCTCEADCPTELHMCERKHPVFANPLNPEGYCVPVCQGNCQNYWYDYKELVTQYEVIVDVIVTACNMGEHQGLAHFGHRYEYDPRFLIGTSNTPYPPWWYADGGTWRRWHQGAPVSVWRQFDMRKTDPVTPSTPTKDEALEPPNEFAYCGHQPTLDTWFHNHGRTLATTVPEADEPWTSDGVIPLYEVVDANICRRERDNAPCGGSTTSDPEDVTACMQLITDGLCDSGCGNCSYVPPAADPPDCPIMNIASRDDTLVVHGEVAYASRHEPPPPSSPLIDYVGRPGDVVTVDDTDWFPFPIGSWSGDWVYPTRNDMTHCVDNAKELADAAAGQPNSQQFGVESGGASDHNFVFGKHGHNSNTDATAQKAMFLACASGPTGFLDDNYTTTMNANVCGVCGATQVDPDLDLPTQYPCGSDIASNTADYFWNPTKNKHNITSLCLGSQRWWDPSMGDCSDTEAAGWIAPTRPAPACNWDDFSVHGM